MLDFSYLRNSKTEFKERHDYMMYKRDTFNYRTSRLLVQPAEVSNWVYVTLGAGYFVT